MQIPELLVNQRGEAITTPEAWREHRTELIRLFGETIYGHTPAGPVEMSATTTEEDPRALGGKAHRKQVAIHLTRSGKHLHLDLLLYLPPGNRDKPVPAFLLLNFCGNHHVTTDPAVIAARSPIPKQHQEPGRGARARRFPIEDIVGRGYALATLYHGDIDPDMDDNFAGHAHALYDTPEPRPANAWATIGAWAWGLSRTLDYLQTDPHIDGTRVAVAGHSRLGKTSLWAGAQDERFALVISNDSGSGGAAIARRKVGERIADGCRVFPYWYCGNYKAYIDREDDLPIDQHQLVALMAPRPVYIASATEDTWADPEGEFLAGHHASPAYGLYGLKGLPGEWPPPDTPLQGGHIGYHVRTGKHDLLAYDWQQFMNFADKHLR